MTQTHNPFTPSAARSGGARPVGVFVDEDAATIARRCDAAGLAFAQLHGDGARAALFDLPLALPVVYVLHATPKGAVQTPTPSQLAQTLGREPRKVSWGGGVRAACIVAHSSSFLTLSSLTPQLLRLLSC